MVTATIDAAVHDLIFRQPTGSARDEAIDLTIATALSIIDAASADQAAVNPARGR